MPEVNYKVDLFYEDIGFTSDYANVLQFDDANARDTYFDNITGKDTFDNTDFNNIQLSGNTIKLAFVDATQIARLEKYNYIRILTRLYGTIEQVNKYDYGFIVDYTIISSSSNVTIVEFTFETDLWQNFQFDFEIKECKVERSHMDRWERNTNKNVYTRPCADLLESFMQKYGNSQKIIKTGRCYNVNGVIEENVPFAIALITVTQVRALDPTDPTRMANGVFFRYFPVRLDKSERIMSSKPTTSGFTTDYFLSISELFLGNITDYFVLNADAIVNVQLLFNTSLDMDIDELHDTLYHYTVIKGNKTEYPMNMGTYNNVRFDACYDSAGEEPINGYKDVISVNITKPIKPQNGADYSEQYEPMMFKSPVFKRYFTNYLTDTIFEVPDTILNIDTEISITTIFSATNSYNILKMVNDEYPTQSLASLSSMFMALDCDVLNNYWKQYVMQNRDADRQLMWANILTGGIAESGSTAVSAGIGYRSNMERAELADISTNLSPMTSMQMNKMYSKYAKQAMGFSVLGGMTAMSANAIGNYARQVSTEMAIKNKPSNLIVKGNAYSTYELSNSNLVYTELRCDDESYKQYANIFKKFGYYIGGVIVPNIKSRKYFNYIKTNGAILTGSLNQSVLAKLCRIFDNGVTIWHMDYTTRATLYNYDKENIERSLIGE